MEGTRREVRGEKTKVEGGQDRGEEQQRGRGERRGHRGGERGKERVREWGRERVGEGESTLDVTRPSHRRWHRFALEAHQTTLKFTEYDSHNPPHLPIIYHSMPGTCERDLCPSPCKAHGEGARQRGHVRCLPVHRMQAGGQPSELQRCVFSREDALHCAVRHGRVMVEVHGEGERQ